MSQSSKRDDVKKLKKKKIPISKNKRLAQLQRGRIREINFGPRVQEMALDAFNEIFQEEMLAQGILRIEIVKTPAKKRSKKSKNKRVKKPKSSVSLKDET